MVAISDVTENFIKCVSLLKFYMPPEGMRLVQICRFKNKETARDSRRRLNS